MFKNLFVYVCSRSSASDDALLPDVKVKGATSPRRSNRENLPLLHGPRLRHNSYDDIDVDCNNFQGNTLNLIVSTNCVTNLDFRNEMLISKSQQTTYEVNIIF
jgi:hypothetical protein